MFHILSFSSSSSYISLHYSLSLYACVFFFFLLMDIYISCSFFLSQLNIQIHARSSRNELIEILILIHKQEERENIIEFVYMCLNTVIVCLRLAVGAVLPSRSGRTTFKAITFGRKIGTLTIGIHECCVPIVSPVLFDIALA